VDREPEDTPRSEPAAGNNPGDDFDRIVAAWQREGEVPSWPDDEVAVEPAAAPAPVAPPPDDDHFVPPEPPPLPRLGPPALVGLVLLGLGIVLVTTPGWVGIPVSYAMPLGLVTLAAGLGWLVLRLWPAAPVRGDGDGEDDGAVL
jgi:hypothetical protein